MTAPERSIRFTNYKLNRAGVFNEHPVQNPITFSSFFLFFKEALFSMLYTVPWEGNTPKGGALTFAFMHKEPHSRR